MVSDPNPDALMQGWGYHFRDLGLLDLALTHSSYQEGPDRNTNERLEFLGDRVLGLVIADLVFKTFPDEQEGALARRLTALVCRDALAGIAQNIGLGSALKLSPGEIEMGGRENPSLLSDALEAVIAAIYLDGGLEPAKDFIIRFWEPLLYAEVKPPKDAKTALQEWAQQQGLDLPHYREVSRQGPDHAPSFEIGVTVGSFPEVMASAPSKRAAEKKAAEDMLAVIAKSGT